MSWDIYGNPLRRGHCEVHPDVHEEYPCFVCLEKSIEKRNREYSFEQEREAWIEKQIAFDEAVEKLNEDLI